MSKKITFFYDVAFNFNLHYGNGRISGKQGTIEIFVDGKEIDTETFKQDAELIAMIKNEVQSKYKRAQVSSLNITSITKQ